MKLKAIIDCKIRFEDGLKREVKKGEVVEVLYMDTVNFFCARGFVRVETKDMGDEDNTKAMKEEKEKAIKEIKKSK